MLCGFPLSEFHFVGLDRFCTFKFELSSKFELDSLVKSVTLPISGMCMGVNFRLAFLLRIPHQFCTLFFNIVQQRSLSFVVIKKVLLVCFIFVI